MKILQPSLQLPMSNACLQRVCIDAFWQDESSERAKQQKAAVAVAAAGKVIAQCACIDAFWQDESSERAKQQQAAVAVAAVDEVVASMPTVCLL